MTKMFFYQGSAAPQQLQLAAPICLLWLVAASFKQEIQTGRIERLPCAALLLRPSAPPPLLLPQIRPRLGWALAYEWTALLFVLQFALVLRGCHCWGQRVAWQGGQWHREERCVIRGRK